MGPLTPELTSGVLDQLVFFVTSALLCPWPTQPNKVAYTDTTGPLGDIDSHVHENGGPTLMDCSFGPAPRILRLFAERVGD